MVRVCVDAMGGDEKPSVVLEGIAQALSQDPDLQVLVCGARDVVVPFCDTHTRACALVTTQTIDMHEHPAEAVRTKRDSSIVQGCRAVKEHRADGFFSAGSTGAIFTAATLEIGRLKGVKRPAIAYAVPSTSQHRTVFLDLGANADVRPNALVQFAVMGRAYSHSMCHVKQPTVCLLSNGRESTKGSQSILEAHAALKAAGSWFIGNCEPTDIFSDYCDVVVCDGFCGNITLKTIESTMKFVAQRLKQAARTSLGAGIGLTLAASAFRDIKHDLSGEEHGGAVLLGLNAPVFIGHGSTSQLAICQGTLACAGAIRSNLVSKLAEDL